MENSTRLEHFFFGPQAMLSGVWHAPQQNIRQVWIFCAPFGEEDKSARRTLNEGARWLAARGHAVLLFNARGAGDSCGDFAQQTLDNWRDDILSAIEEVRRRVPNAPLGLLGVRLGAALAAQISGENNANSQTDSWRDSLKHVILLEPILSGQRYWSEMAMRQKLRAKITSQEGNPNDNAQAKTSQIPNSESDVFDLDGWPIGEKLQADLRALDLENERNWPASMRVQVFQIGARSEVSNALKNWCEARQISASAIVAQPFWNLLDHAPSEKLWAQIFPEESAIAPAASTCDHENVARRSASTCNGERALIVSNRRDERLVATWHLAQNGAKTARATIVMLHGWSGYRTGPHQMLARAARRWTDDYNLLRFDFAGRGDSDGRTELATLATMADDARDMMKWCREQSDAPIVLLGLCSGCEVAVGALESDVAAMILWSAPIVAARGSGARDARKRVANLKKYAHKLLSFSTYKRLLRGEVDASRVAQVMSSKGGESRNIESDAPGQLPRGWRESALSGFARWNRAHRPLLLVYGSADPTTTEALAWYREQQPQAYSHLIEGANHSYYGLEWENEVIAHSQQWLDEVLEL